MYDANYVACQIPEAEDQPPNKLLFLQNLPNEITEIMLQTLFKQFPGLSEVKTYIHCITYLGMFDH
jgi:hypothetical protein